jgi:integrase
MQGKRTRALDSRGRPIPGLYVRDGRFIAGFNCPRVGRWRMETLGAETITEARRERDSLLAGLREARVAAPDRATFADVFSEYQAARNLSQRTSAHELDLVGWHLSTLKTRRVQDVTASEVAWLLRGMRDTYSAWTCVAVYRILRGTFALAVRRGILTRSPVEGLARSEIPKQRNARTIAVLDAERMAKLVAAGGSERWRAALALAGYGGLRLGELRALTWADVDLEAGTLTVRRSLLRDGTPKPPKTDAGTRTVPILPALRRRLVAWKLRSPKAKPTDPVVATGDGGPVQERNLRRALDDAKETAGLGETEERLSWHSLRHSFASMLATDLSLPATTLARLTGHADAGFTLRVYARDGRDDVALVEDVLARAAGAGIGV